MKWIRRLLGLCEHKWKVINEQKCVCADMGPYTRIILQCEKCGNVKGKEV